MSKHRAAIALSLTAVAVAVLGQTSIGHAAVNTVRVALFAENSARVNNIQASRTPMPGRLLALNAKGKLPASVLPARMPGGQTYTHTIVVHPDADFKKAGSALLRAVATIAGNSASNRYLVKIEPGVYDVREQSLAMKEYVDIEGSGEGVTTITSTNSSGSGTLIGANHSELRYTTVTNTGGGQQSVALFAESTSPRFSNVTAMSSGGSENYGIHLSNGSAVLTNVTATATGGATAIGMANFNGNTTASASSFTGTDAAGLVVGVLTTYGGSVKLQSSAVTASGGSVAMGMRSYNGNHVLANVTMAASSSSGGESFGIYNGQKTSGPTVQVSHSKVSAQTNSVFVLGGSVRLGATQMTGPVATQDLGTVRCVYAYDGNFNPLAGCP